MVSAEGFRFGCGGDGGIRTLGRKLSLRRFSKPLVSTTHPRLREGLQATAYISGGRKVQPARHRIITMCQASAAPSILAPVERAPSGNRLVWARYRLGSPPIHGRERFGGA